MEIETDSADVSSVIRTSRPLIVSCYNHSLHACCIPDAL
jgi:hypothetical protein